MRRMLLRAASPIRACRKRSPAVNGVVAVAAFPDGIELVCSAAFIGSAVSAFARSGDKGEGGQSGAEALCRILERGCHNSAERSETVLKELLNLLKSEGEAAAGLCEQILLHLLTKQNDDLQSHRCGLALRRPNGLIGLINELESKTSDGEEEKKDEKPAASGSSSARSLERVGKVLLVHSFTSRGERGDAYACCMERRLAHRGAVDAMVRWLKDASRTAALGQEKPAARLLGVKLGRRSGV